MGRAAWRRHTLLPDRHNGCWPRPRSHPRCLCCQQPCCPAYLLLPLDRLPRKRLLLDLLPPKLLLLLLLHP